MSGLSSPQRRCLKEHLSHLFWWINLNIRLLLLLPSACLSCQVLKIAKARFAIWRIYLSKISGQDHILNRRRTVELLLNCIRTVLTWRSMKNDRARDWLIFKFCGKAKRGNKCGWILTERQNGIFPKPRLFPSKLLGGDGLVCSDGMRSADTRLSLRAMSRVNHVWPGMSCPLRRKWSGKSASVTLFHFHLCSNVFVHVLMRAYESLRPFWLTPTEDI